MNRIVLLDRDGTVIVDPPDERVTSEGKISIEDLERINAEVIRRLEVSGTQFLKSYMCPHGPNDGCASRKPQPKMILDAAQDYNLDLASTFMIGDHRSDVLAGQAAGAKGILVKTANHEDDSPEADYIAQNLTEAVDYIIANS